MKRVGILGGTFNPVHLAHLRTALEVYEHFALDSILFIPTYIPPHKMDDESIVSPEIRLDMLKMAVADVSGFQVNDMEITRKEISYSIDTVKELQAKHSDTRFYFIIGADAFYEISTWNNYEEFVFLVDFIIMTRPKSPLKGLDELLPEDILRRFSLDPEHNRYVSSSGTEIHFHTVSKLDISSTEIRSLIREGKSIKYLVPANVEEFILKNNLYK
jgi:nicotinate-nucleotide adenylyltransferase